MNAVGVGVDLVEVARARAMIADKGAHVFDRLLTPAEFGAMVPRADSAALRRPEEPSVTVDPTLTAPGT